MENILLVFGAIGGFMRTYSLFFGACALLVNLIAFIMYAVDKRAAKQRKWRIPERNLICIALIGGSVGAFIAMQMLRHKTKHKKFTITVPLFMVLQIAFTVFCLIV